MNIDLTINGHHVRLSGQLTPSGWFAGFDVAKAGLEIDRHEKIYVSINVVPDGFYEGPATGKALEADNYVEGLANKSAAQPPKREYALRQISLDTDQEIIHSHTEDEKAVAVWRERKQDRQTIISRGVGEWQEEK